jgi:hypothetical protein
MASINTQNKRKARSRAISAVNDSLLWRYKRAKQRAWLASGRNGSWFTGGVTRNLTIVGAPY